MHIVIGNDHAGPKLKEVIKEHLQSKGHKVSDLGVKEGEKIDYPIIAKEVACIDYVDKLLTLNGLKILYDLNRSEDKK